jgi:hypothetical protein
MSQSTVFFVGLPTEVGHHAAPIAERIPIQVVAADQVDSIAKPGDLAIFFSEHFDRFRHLITLLKQRQVATLYMIDGILEWRNAWENRDDEPACPFTMRPVLAHKAACIGPSQARVLEAWGNRGKSEIVGVPRFDRFWNSSKNKVRDPSKFQLLVMTAKVPGFTPEQLARTRQSLIDLKSWIDREQIAREVLPNRKLNVCWRLTAGLDQELQIENELSDLTGRELADQLLEADAVISTPSTAMLEAMIFGLPVASLDYHLCPSYLSTAWTIGHAAAIKQVIAELAHPPESKLLFQRTHLHDALALAPDIETRPAATATDRMVDLIQGMREIAQRRIEENQPLQFPFQILNPIPPAVHAFDHQQMFPRFREFELTDQSDDPLMLRVELAQARREIEHLQRELAQCKSELGQAHSIFDQIHQHPVAGPIVRLRQKFLDWQSRNQPPAEGK